MKRESFFNSKDGKLLGKSLVLKEYNIEFEFSELILNEYLQTTEFKFFSTKVYNEMSQRFLEMNKEELKMLKMMKPSSV